MWDWFVEDCFLYEGGGIFLDDYWIVLWEFCF